jgi:hypothetical protein
VIDYWRIFIFKKKKMKYSNLCTMLELFWFVHIWIYYLNLELNSKFEI